MAETAAHLVDRVLPQESVRQWVVSFPWELRRKLGYRPQLLSKVLGVVMRALLGYGGGTGDCASDLRWCIKAENLPC